MAPIRPLLLCVILLNACLLNAQCGAQVLHWGGTAVVAGTSVTVTPFDNYTYASICGPTSGPYLCGNLSGPGGFIFDFSPPVDSVMLDFSSIHTSTTYDEIMRVFVDGAHYAIPSASTAVICLNELAVLTAEGDVAAVPGATCGWHGTVVPGPITTLVVKDSISLGQPGGAFCSLFICPSQAASVMAAQGRTTWELHPNPATDHFIVNTLGLQAPELAITDLRGNSVRAPMQLAQSAQERIATGDLAPGCYLVRLMTKDFLDVRKLTIAGR